MGWWLLTRYGLCVLEWSASMIASEPRCADGRLLRIPFTTVFDYILLLRVVAQELQARLGPARDPSHHSSLLSLSSDCYADLRS